MCWAIFAQAQEPAKNYDADTKTVSSTVLALYDVISGGKDKPRDWDRFRNLFAPGARMVPTFKIGEKFSSMVLAAEDYVTKFGPGLLRDGFFEKEIGRKTDVYGPIAQVFSVYESRLKSKEEKPFAKGVNSIQLIFDGDRWWVQSISWADEATAGPVPSFGESGGDRSTVLPGRESYRAPCSVPMVGEGLEDCEAVWLLAW